MQRLTADGALGSFEQANAAFGDAVDLEGDTAVIGAPFEDVTGTDNGAVYIFIRTGSAWVQWQRLAPNATNSSLFGRQVAISRNEEWICVARQDNVGGGAVNSALHMYRFNAITSQYDPFAIIGGFFDSQFEGANQPSLDFGDANDYLILGTPGDQTMEGGAAYVFRFNGSTWYQPDTGLPMPNFDEKLHLGAGLPVNNIPNDDDRFGWSVALVGTPPNQSALVGAPNWRKDVNANRKGAVLWFRQIGFNAFTWRNIGPNGALEICDTTPCFDGYDGSTDTEFGRDLDVTADQLRVLVGAQNYEDAGDPDQAGKVFALRDDEVGIAPEVFLVDQVIKDFELASAQAFGGQLEMRVPGTVMVGELGDDEGGTNRGAVHIFKNSTGVWAHVAKIQPPVSELPAQGAGDFLSGAFRIGMGARYAVIGATGGIDGSGTRIGSAWIVDHLMCPVFRRGHL